MVIIAVDTFIRRRGTVTPTPAAPPQRAWPGLRPSALIAVAALTFALVFGWVTDYRYYSPNRVSPGYWVQTAHYWLEACDRSKTGEISLPAWDARAVTVPCSRIRG
jgi:hypothetical protein